MLICGGRRATLGAMMKMQATAMMKMPGRMAMPGALARPRS